ncbi:hypothetical protein ACFPRL_04000 [Pseudoclavibacter helvolus]
MNWATRCSEEAIPRRAASTCRLSSAALPPPDRSTRCCAMLRDSSLARCRESASVRASARVDVRASRARVSASASRRPSPF